MTNQEALTYLINELQNMEDENLKPDPKVEMKKDVYRISIAVLKKSIPKKPIYQGAYAPVLCPSCGEELSQHIRDGYYRCSKPKVCGTCNQVLDWGRGDDENEDESEN